MRIALVTMLAVCALAAEAAAQPAKTPADALTAKLARDAELADQNARSEALNVAVNRRNAAVEARNKAVREADAHAQADYKTAQAAWVAEVARMKADADKAQADYAKSKAAWEARVADCKAGKIAACAPPPG